MEEILKYLDWIAFGIGILFFILVKVSALTDKHIVFISEILEFIQKKAEEYEIYKVARIISSVLPVLYFLAENTLKVGKEKKMFVVEKLTNSLKLEELDKDKKQKIAEYMNIAIETLNYAQKHESSELAKSVLDKVFKLKFPVVSFLFYLIKKVIAK